MIFRKKFECSPNAMCDEVKLRSGPRGYRIGAEVENYSFSKSLKILFHIVQQIDRNHNTMCGAKRWNYIV